MSSIQHGVTRFQIVAKAGAIANVLACHCDCDCLLHSGSDSFKSALQALAKDEADKLFMKLMRTSEGALSEEGVQLLENAKKCQKQMASCGQVLANLHLAESPEGGTKLADLQHLVAECRSAGASLPPCLKQRLYKVGVRD